MKQNTAAFTKMSVHWIAEKRIWYTVGVVIILFLATYNLTSYPTTWFDEGSHLHVPKTLLQHNVYADISSDGFRYFGPTVGVGPTVFLPIALSFKLFGIGLFQARIVMVLYLLAAVWAFYGLSRSFGPASLAVVATLLLLSSRAVGVLEYGRQVLGEVPGFFFLAAGFTLWFSTWKKPTWTRMAAAGVVIGLSMVTKNQYLLVVGPTMALAWVANLLYYRTTPNRAFLVPGAVAFLCFVLWNVYLTVYLGPATASENFTMMRNATQGAALVFSTDLMKRSLSLLLSSDVFLTMLFPALGYGLYLSLPRSQSGQQWGVLFILAAFNLAWYVLASISWLRYAFPALAVGSLFIARFFYDLTNGYKVNLTNLRPFTKAKDAGEKSGAPALVLLLWLAVMIALPLLQTTKNIVLPKFNAPVAMAEYMDQNVPQDALVETWEPEMGFLTDHKYHYPPTGMLNTAVGYIWLGKESPTSQYNFIEEEMPPYVLVGGFARWVQVYPEEVLQAHYRLVKTIDSYTLYQLAP